MARRVQPFVNNCQPFQIGNTLNIHTKILGGVSVFALLGFAGAASANVAVLGETSSYTLSLSDPTAGLGAGPFGTISILELSANSLRVTLDLNDPAYKFHDGNDNHPALAFNLAGAPTITYSFIDPVGGIVDQAVDGKFVSGGAGASSPFGSFGYSLDYNRLAPPPPNKPATPFAGPLVFSITSASGLDVSSFVSNLYQGHDVFFTADLVNATGATGNVGAILDNRALTTGAVPEPAMWAMMLTGFFGAGAVLRHNRRRMAVAAA